MIIAGTENQTQVFPYIPYILRIDCPDIPFLVAVPVPAIGYVLKLVKRLSSERVEIGRKANVGLALVLKSGARQKFIVFCKLVVEE